MKPQFLGVRAAAANIAEGSFGHYTAAMFQADFPQFYTKGTENKSAAPLLPKVQLAMFINEANGVVSPERWGEGWRYVAHQASLYLRTYAEGSDSPAQAAQSGALLGQVKAAKLGNASITYDTSAVTAATDNWGDLNATQYGQILATRARLIGMGASYVI